MVLNNNISKNKIKLIALDIDGTLIDDDFSVSNRLINKLHELRDKGTEIVLATGRNYSSAVGVSKQLSMKVPIIAHNGSKVVLSCGTELLNAKIPLAEAKKIIEYSESNNIYTKLYLDDVLYVKEDDEHSLIYTETHLMERKIVGTLSEYLNEDVNMIVTLYNRNIEQGYLERFDDINVSVTMSMPHSLEFMDNNISKGNALKILAKHLNIKNEEILSVGNALNDLEMLKISGVGIAMKNSDDDLLKRWGQISQYTNNNDGVYHIIKDL